MFLVAGGGLLSHRTAQPDIFELRCKGSNKMSILLLKLQH